MKSEKEKDMVKVKIPKDVDALLDKIMKKNPDFEDKETLLFYCIRSYYEKLIASEKQ